MMSRLGSLPVIQALEDGDRWPPDNLVSQAHHISVLLIWARELASRNKTNSNGFLTSILGFHMHAHTSKHSAYTHMCTHKGKFFLQKFFAYLLSSFPFTAIYIISISGNNLVYCKQKTLEWKPCIYYFQNNLGTRGRLFSAPCCRNITALFPFWTHNTRGRAFLVFPPNCCWVSRKMSVSQNQTH